LLTPEQVEKAFRKPMEKLAVYVSESKLHGQVLGIVSGDLSRSVLPSVQVNGMAASFGTPLGYGKAWETGDVPGQAAREWAMPGAEEYVNSGKFGRRFMDALVGELRR
jgi:hypothetical protein